MVQALCFEIAVKILTEDSYSKSGLNQRIYHHIDFISDSLLYVSECSFLQIESIQINHKDHF